MITDWTSLTLDQLRDIARADDPGKVFNAIDPQFTFPINGLLVARHRAAHLSRRTSACDGASLNLSTQPHTMHLHGFYFEVDSLGDGLREHDSSTPRNSGS